MCRCLWLFVWVGGWTGECSHVRYSSEEEQITCDLDRLEGKEPPKLDPGV